MSCEQIQDELVAFVLDDLPLGECRRVQQHLDSGCHACNEELKQVREQLDCVFDMVPDNRLTDLEVDQIHQQVLAKHNANERLVAPIRTGLSAPIAYAASFAAGLLLAVIAYQFADQAPSSEPRIAERNESKTNSEANVDGTPFPIVEDEIPDFFQNHSDIVFTAFEIESESASTHRIRSMLLYDAISKELHYFAESETDIGPHDFDLVILTPAGVEISRHTLRLDSSGKASAVLGQIDTSEFAFRIEYSN